MSPRVLSREAARTQHEQRRTATLVADPAPGSADQAHPYFDRPATAQERTRVFAAGVELVRQWLPESRGPATDRADAERVVGRLLDYLDSVAGASYQQRWMSCGADAAGKDWLPPYASGPSKRLGARQALNALLVLGVIRPSIEWLLECKQARFWRDWTVHHDSASWDRLFAICQQEKVRERVAWNGYATLIRICIHHGIGLEDITAEHVLDFRTRTLATGRVGRTLYSLWHHAKLAGLLHNAPDSLDALLLQGQRSPAELVDHYRVADPAIRQLLIDYVTEMSTTSDYASLANTARVLVHLFWCDLQDHHPELDTIALTQEQATAWKQRIKTRPDGNPRRNAYSVLGAVRSFYLDIAAWAHEDPAHWGPWAVPCPISIRDVRGYKAQRRRTTERMQGRTRTLAPLMPRLSDFARGRHRRAVELLERSRTAQVGETFTLHDQHYTRLALTRGASASAIRLTTPEQAKRVDPAWQEIQRFWAWAAIETLRHSGIRIEELLELTHLSIRQFRKPDGEILPLLQIAPSKSDQERILPASPELTAVLARIVARLTDGGGTVPLAIKRDEHELVHSAPMPYLFQHREGGRSRGMSSGTIRKYLSETATAMGLRDVDGQPLTFTPHDFRRMFITDLVNEGFPIHLAAQIVGHASIETTRGYTAVYEKDVFLAYDSFIVTRRTLRPSTEYRDPTQQEWAAFHEHFLRRKVSLGDCHRPYGSDCSHEHACIRCQFLQIDPAHVGRLAEIEDNLHARVDEAKANSWLGDVDQLLVTLGHLDSKKDQVQRMLDTLPTPLLTAVPDVAPFP